MLQLRAAHAASFLIFARQCASVRSSSSLFSSPATTYEDEDDDEPPLSRWQKGIAPAKDAISTSVVRRWWCLRTARKAFWR